MTFNPLYFLLYPLPLALATGVSHENSADNFCVGNASPLHMNIILLLLVVFACIAAYIYVSYIKKPPTPRMWFTFTNIK